MHPLLVFAALNLAAAISPGPAFVLVTRTAAAGTAGLPYFRSNGFRVAMGTAFASMTWALAALLGVEAILTQAAALYRIIQFAGGLYLSYVGWQIWRGAGKPLAALDASTSAPLAGFKAGFLLGVSNPKVIVFFATVFGTVFPANAPALMRWAAVPVVLAIEVLWYSTLAWIFSSEPVQGLYQRIRGWFERCCGGLLAFFGLRLAASAVIQRA